MSGGGPGLYMRGGASDSTNLDAVNGFDERQLLVNESQPSVTSNGHDHDSPVINESQSSVTSNGQDHNSPVITGNVYCLFQYSQQQNVLSSQRTAPHRPSGRATASASARLGKASECVRACGSPTSSYRLHKWCTRDPPFKSVEILLKSRYGIKQLIP